MEKNDEGLKSFENKLNNNFFKFLVREYYSQSINPFQVLKMMSKILSSKISKILKLKYILFFLQILKNFTLNESVFNQNINMIINETLGDILTRKADYVLIIQYAIFLVQIGEIDFALSRLQIFSTDPRFMNNGELIFYRGIISYISEPSNQCFTSFEKSLSLIKKDVNLYCEWVIKFLAHKNMLTELRSLLKHDKIKEYFENVDKTQNINFYNALNDADFIDINKKISILAKEMENDFTNFLMILRFTEFIENYYSDSEHYTNNNSEFLVKLVKLNPYYLFTYLKFLYNHILFDFKNMTCASLLENILISIKKFSDGKMLNNILNEEQMKILTNLIIEHLKIMYEILLKGKICQNILIISCKEKTKEMIKYSKKKMKIENDKETIKTLLRIMNLIDFNYFVIYGESMSKKLDVNFEDKRLFVDRAFTQKFVKLIKNFK